jgi:GR25 family glycosyltransferase involved in LPS biosynthesis
MLNFIDLKIIHLTKRTDRLLECGEELNKINFVEKDDTYFLAKEVQNLGARGCALSHAMALSEFLFNSDNPFVLILEDDFSIREPARFWGDVEKAIQNSSLWDVYLLGYNHVAAIEMTPIENTFRGINSQTASGYIVKRNYAPKLIECFFRSAELLNTYQDLPSPNKEILLQSVCCDMLWKELQLKDKFWFSIPSQILQRPSYSDIEKAHVNYGT